MSSPVAKTPAALVESPDPGAGDVPPGHEIGLELPGKVRLSLLLWGEEHRWIFRHRLEVEGAESFTKDLVCHTSLAVDYKRGMVQPDLTLAMHVILPQRAGQVSFLGVDISPGYKTYLDWSYRRGPKGGFRLRQLQVGARPPICFDQGQGLIKPVELPFPVPTEIPEEYGRFKVPYRADAAGNLGSFDFPACTLQVRAPRFEELLRETDGEDHG